MPEALAHRLYELISKLNTPRDFHSGLREAQRRSADLGNELAGKAPKPLACRAGGSLRCSIRVEVYAHEVSLIAYHLQTATDPAELERVRTDLAAHADEVRPLTLLRRHRRSPVQGLMNPWMKKLLSKEKNGNAGVTKLLKDF